VREFLEHNLQLQHTATHAVDTPHHYTDDEIEALQKLSETQCAHTPHLLGVAHEREPPGVDKEGMAGGFAIFILMKAITPSLLKDKALEEREVIRAAFKKAIM
jgi:hypothetical protein